VNHFLHLLLSAPLQLQSSLPLSPQIRSLSSATSSVLCTSTSSSSSSSTLEKSCRSTTQGIYPLMKDFACGHENMATPRALLNTTAPGKGRIVVDVGLFSGEETFDALEAGFVVFGFELNAGSIPVIRDNAKKRNILDRVHFVEYVPDNKTGSPIAKELPRPPKDGKGYAYIFNAGLSDEEGSVYATNQHNAVASVGGQSSAKWSPGRVPILRLDQTLPEWVRRVFFLKIGAHCCSHCLLFQFILFST
jgi:hypothetical protein